MFSPYVILVFIFCTVVFGQQQVHFDWIAQLFLLHTEIVLPVLHSSNLDSLKLMHTYRVVVGGVTGRKAVPAVVVSLEKIVPASVVSLEEKNIPMLMASLGRKCVVMLLVSVWRGGAP